MMKYFSTIKRIGTIVVLIAIGVLAYNVIQWGGGWSVLISNPDTWVNEIIGTMEGWFFRLAE